MSKILLLLSAFMVLSLNANRFAKLGTSCSNSFCGGIAGTRCCAGMSCKIDADYPDAGGQCILTQQPVDSCPGAFCGGFAGIQCCSGYSCELDGNYPDASGKCVHNVGSSGCTGQFCGGFAGLPCCAGSNCKLEGHFPDAPGVCS